MSSKKIVTKRGKKKALMSEHCHHVKVRRANQPTKKKDCHVGFTVKKIFTFDDFKISKDSRRGRLNSSTKIKQMLRTNIDQVQGSLKYVTSFPSEVESRIAHRIHNTGRTAGYSEKLDERVCSYLKNLIQKGVVAIKDLKSRAVEFLEEKIFFGEWKPTANRKRFYPTNRKIRNLITAVRLKHRFSTFDQENISEAMKNWQKWADIHFVPR